MGSPIIFNGTNAKLLNSSGKLLDSSARVIAGVGTTGAINFLMDVDPNDFHYEDTIGTGVSYDDGATATPVDGTGGSPATLTVTRTTNAAEVIRGVGSLKIAKSAADGQGEGYAIPVVIPDGYADYPRNLVYQFAYRVTANFDYGSGTAADPSDVSIYFYDVTNSKLVYPDRSFLDGSGQHVCQVQFDAGCVSARALFHVATTNANAYDFIADDVQVGPAAMVPQAIVTRPAPVTITGSWVTNTTYSAMWWRNGKMARFNVLVETSGAPTTATLTLTLPVTIDTTALGDTSPAAGAYILLSSGTAVDSGTRDASLSVAYQTATTVSIIAEDATGGAAVTQAAPFTWGSGDYLNVEFEVPVVGWDSGALVAVQDAHRDVRVQVTGDPASAAGADAIIFPTVTHDTHGAYNATTGTFTAPRAGYVHIHGAMFTGSNSVNVHAYVNGVSRCYIGTVDGSHGDTAYTGTVKVNPGDLVTVRPDNTLDVITASVMNFEMLGSPPAVLASEEVAARAHNSATAITGSLATIVWTTEDYDTHNALASGVFTCPAPGKYAVYAKLALSGTFVLNNTSVIEVQKGGVATANKTQYIAAAITNDSIDIYDEVNCTTGDLLRVQASNSGTGPAIVSSDTRNYITIHRI